MYFNSRTLGGSPNGVHEGEKKQEISEGISKDRMLANAQRGGLGADGGRRMCQGVCVKEEGRGNWVGRWTPRKNDKKKFHGSMKNERREAEKQSYVCSNRCLGDLPLLTIDGNPFTKAHTRKAH